MSARLPAALAVAMVLRGAGPVQVWSSAGAKAGAAKLAPAARIQGETLGAWGSHSASLWKRTASGEAELHKTKSDVLIVEDGSATFLSGGSIEGAHPASAGEIRGTAVVNGESRKLVPGDVVHVPAGTPHQFVLEKGQSITYLAFKIAR